MSVSLIGLMFAGAGAVSMFWARLAAFRVLCIAILFGAASAIVMGPANITPGHLVLGLFTLALVLRKNGLHELFDQMAFPRAGFFLLLTTVWAVFTALIMPRVFAGLVYVIPVSTELRIYLEQPLYPRSTNITQSVYMIGNLVAFCGAAALVRTPHTMRKAAFALIIAGYVNLAIAALDSATYAAGIPQIMDFMRNADYAQAYTAVVMGMKRITGSFPEASSFATFSAGLFAFAFRLWRGGIYTTLSGYLALGTFVAITLAFSTSGYVAIGIYLALIYSRNLAGIDIPGGKTPQNAFQRHTLIALGPVGAIVIGMIVAFRPDLLDPVTNMFDTSIADKLSSSSGQERMAWNMSGLENILETYGLGVGLGSVRVSSFLVAVPANIGIIGTILMGLFIYRVFYPTHRVRMVRGTEYGQIQAAARSACFASLIGASLSSTTMDLGLLFSLCAGMACAWIIVPAPASPPENQDPAAGPAPQPGPAGKVLPDGQYG